MKSFGIDALCKDFGGVYVGVNKAVGKHHYEVFHDEDGARVEVFIGVQDGKGSNPQLARVHAMIREIASELGYTFEEVKLQVKRKAGLCFVKNNVEHCKSFAKCDKEELNLAIQAAMEIGDFSGMQLR